MLKAGIDSIEGSRENNLSQIQQIRADIFSTQAQLAEHEATLLLISGDIKTEKSEEPASTAPQFSVPIASEYRLLASRLASLRDQETTLLVQFTDESVLVKEIRTRIETIESQKKTLESDYPMLTQVSNQIDGTLIANPIINPRSEAIRIAALRSRLDVLSKQKTTIQDELDKANKGGIAINELLRRIELDEANYNNFQVRLEQERINESFGSGKVNGITIVQSPTPPYLGKSIAIPMAAGAAIAGLVLGIAWAFAIEFYLDRSIKSPLDIERSIDVPLFISLPDKTRSLKGKSGKQKNKQKMLDLYFSQKENGEEGAPRPSTALDIHGFSQDPTSPLYPYFEALRDRLVGFFDSRDLRHSPKLIGLTGLGKSPGVTTLSSGLASCLSKTEEGNVLLVDMTVGQESSRQYYKGKEICDLDDALKSKSNAQIEDNLYVAKESSSIENSKIPSLLPKRFSNIVPKLKASNFDYIIFDMPGVSPISPTPRLAGFMDVMLVVIESEKVDRDVLKQAIKLMEQSNTNLGIVLNKTKTYGPKFLQEEFFGSS